MVKVVIKALFIVGAIIGAGFASGQEIVTFFREDGLNVSSCLLCGAVTFVFCFTLLHVGRRVKKSSVAKANACIFGKFSALVTALMTANSIIVLSGMLSALNQIGGMIFKAKPFYGIIASVLSCLFVYSSNINTQKSGAAMVVIIVLAIAWVGRSAISSESLLCYNKVYFVNIIIYVAMNMLLASGLLVTESSLSRKEIAAVSIIVSIVITILSLVICLLIRGNHNQVMPLLEVAKSMGKTAYASIIIAMILSIFTTIIATSVQVFDYFHQIFGKNMLVNAVVLIAANAISFLGFSKVVSALYPVIGVIGLAYFLFSAAYLASPFFNKLFNKSNTKIHNSRKQAKNNR